MKKYKIVFACLLVLSLLALRTFYSVMPNIRYIYHSDSANVSCHYMNGNDFLLSIEDASFSPPEQSIFFHETSCRGGLNARQACSVESAARALPGWRVHVVFSSPVTEIALNQSSMYLLRKKFSNVYFLRVHILDYVANTPVERLVRSGALSYSRWPISHTSDMLRLLTLYKWGGVYLDFDLLVNKSLAALGPNWVAKESNWSITNCMLALSRDHIGKKFAKAFIRICAMKINWAMTELKKAIFCLTALSLFTVTILYSLMLDEKYKRGGDVSCHYVNSDDFLLSIEDASFSPPEQSIFFHETSCRGGLNARQACSVESAARAHPGWRVHVVFSSSVTETALHQGPMSLLRKVFSNVHFLRVHILDYVANTPIRKLVHDGSLSFSQFPIAHSSDILRLLTLYKWGGLYLDLDVLVNKPLVELGPNWVARESNWTIANGMLALSRNDIGKTFAKAFISHFASTFKGDKWANNGPGVITRVLMSMCSTRRVPEMRASVCQGFEVHNASSMYPVPWQQAKYYFSPGYVHLGNPYTHHIWNKITFNYEKNEMNDRETLPHNFHIFTRGFVICKLSSFPTRVFFPKLTSRY